MYTLINFPASDAFQNFRTFFFPTELKFITTCMTFFCISTCVVLAVILKAVLSGGNEAFNWSATQRRSALCAHNIGLPCVHLILVPLGFVLSVVFQCHPHLMWCVCGLPLPPSPDVVCMWSSNVTLTRCGAYVVFQCHPHPMWCVCGLPMPPSPIVVRTRHNRHG